MGFNQKADGFMGYEEGLSKHLDGQCLKEHLSGSDIVGGTLFLASAPQNDDLSGFSHRRRRCSYRMSNLSDITLIAADWGIKFAHLGHRSSGASY